jgi:hypothetical protein
MLQKDFWGGDRNFSIGVFSFATAANLSWQKARSQLQISAKRVGKLHLAGRPSCTRFQTSGVMRLGSALH